MALPRSGPSSISLNQLINAILVLSCSKLRYNLSTRAHHLSPVPTHLTDSHSLPVGGRSAPSTPCREALSRSYTGLGHFKLYAHSGRTSSAEAAPSCMCVSVLIRKQSHPSSFSSELFGMTIPEGTRATNPPLVRLSWCSDPSVYLHSSAWEREPHKPEQQVMPARTASLPRIQERHRI